MTPKVAVLGGGVSGLACAQRLLSIARTRKQECDVVLIESSSRLGGTIQTENVDGFLLEKGPDCFLSQKASFLSLCKEWGLESSLAGTNAENRKSFVAHPRGLFPLPRGFYLIAPVDPWPFLSTPLFSPAGKARMMFETLVPGYRSEKDESLGAFMRRRFGYEAFRNVGQAMLGGIYAGNPDELSLQATMPLLRDLEKEHRSVILGLAKRARTKKALAEASGPRYSLFLSFDQGMQVLTDRLAQDLPAERVIYSTKVTGLAREGSRWRIESDRKESFLVDAVFSALPACVLATVLREDGPLPGLLRRIPFETVATAHWAYRREDVAHPLDGFGFVVPAYLRKTTMACTFSSRKFRGRAKEGFVLLRGFSGGAFGHEAVARGDEDLMDAIEKELSDWLGIRGRPVFRQLTRFTEVMPQYRVGHLDLVRQIKSELDTCPGLYLTGSSFKGSGIPDCVQDAQEQADDFWNRHTETAAKGLRP